MGNASDGKPDRRLFSVVQEGLVFPPAASPAHSVLLDDLCGGDRRRIRKIVDLDGARANRRRKVGNPRGLSGDLRIDSGLRRFALARSPGRRGVVIDDYKNERGKSNMTSKIDQRKSDA